MMSASGTIEVKPHDVSPRDPVDCNVRYIPGTPPGDDVRPNDVHIEYRRLNGSLFGDPPWTPAYGDNSFPPGTDTVTPGIRCPLIAPEEPDTYDIRVRWTLDGETIAERTGQFAVIEANKKSASHYVVQGLKTIGLVGSLPLLIIALGNWGLATFYDAAPPRTPRNCRRRMSAHWLRREHRIGWYECFDRGRNSLRYCNMRCTLMSELGLGRVKTPWRKH